MLLRLNQGPCWTLRDSAEGESCDPLTCIPQHGQSEPRWGGLQLERVRSLRHMFHPPQQ